MISYLIIAAVTFSIIVVVIKLSRLIPNLPGINFSDVTLAGAWRATRVVVFVAGGLLLTYYLLAN